jgi:hypothetical protein
MSGAEPASGRLRQIPVAAIAIAQLHEIRPPKD